MRSNKSLRGFSLLELTVAILILGMSLLVIFQIQARSIRMAMKARNITVATMLARAKILDCKYLLQEHGFGASDFSEDGDFRDEGFPDYTWECHSYRFDIPKPSPDAIAQAMKAKAKSGKDENSGGGAMGDINAGMLAPFFAVISDTLASSIRELVTIVRWKDQEYDEHLQVTTHIIDKAALAALVATIPNGQIPPGMLKAAAQGGAPK